MHLERNRLFGNALLEGGGSACDGGIVVARNNVDTLIANNLIYRNGHNGISFIDQDGGPHYVIANTIYANEWNGVEVARHHETYLINNLIVHNGQASGTTGGRFGVVRENATTPHPGAIHLLHNLICGNTNPAEIAQDWTQILDSTDSGPWTPTGVQGPGVNRAIS